MLGCAAIVLPEHARIPDMLLVNVYGRVASIALQRHIAEESSRNSEEMFFNIADLSPSPIAIIDKEGVYRYINKSFTHLFGYDLHDFRKGREWFLLAYPDPEYRKTAIQIVDCRPYPITGRRGQAGNVYLYGAKTGRTKRYYSGRERLPTGRSVLFMKILLNGERQKK